MINKLFPRKLNRSLDSRLRKPEDMIDAINVVIGDEFSQEGDGANSSVGNVGVLKPVVSNRGVPNNTPLDQLPVDRIVKIIGSVTDDKIGVIYFFVWCDYAPAQGVYAYDQYGVLPGSEGECVRKVFTHPQFNFPQNGFVKGDVVHTGDGFSFNLSTVPDVFSYEAERASIIYFTDNVNEPRKLSVFRAMTSIELEQGNNYNLYDFADFITACPKTPVHPITFEFQSDPSRSVSDFENRNGFQFAYQHIYEDGEESAISVYSDIAVPPAYVQQGTLNNPNLVASNLCVLTIPADVDDSQVRSLEIKKIRILAREGNRGVFYVIDEVDSVLDGVPARPVDVEYQFYNDRIVSAAPVEDVNKMFDSLPKKAEAQAVVSDRLFYGNYVEGFDNVHVEAEITPVYYDRPQDFISLSLTAHPEVFFVNYDDQLPERRAGFRISPDDLPDFLEENTVISVELVCMPEGGIHIYNSQNSFHGNRFVFDDGVGLNAPLERTISETYSSNEHSDGVAKVTPPLFGENIGVSAVLDSDTFPKWVTTQSASGDTAAGTESDVCYGTSSANPLVVRGQELVFSCSVLTTEDISQNSKQRVTSAIVSALTSPESFNEDGFDLISSNGVFTYSFDLDIQDGEFYSTSSSDKILNLITAAGRKNQILSGAPASNGVQATEEVFNLDNPITGSSINTGSYRQSLAPCGYFLIGRGDVSVKLRDSSFVSDNIQTIAQEEFGNHGFVSIDIENLSVGQNDIYTCIPSIALNTGTTGTNPDFSDGTFKVLSVSGWRMYSSQFMIDLVSSGENIDAGLFNKNISPEELQMSVLAYTSEPISVNDRDFNTSFSERRLGVGYLNLNGQNLYTNTEQRVERLEEAGQQVSPLNNSGVTIVDGEGGFDFTFAPNFGASIASIGGISSQSIYQGSCGKYFTQRGLVFFYTGVASPPIARIPALRKILLSNDPCFLYRPEPQVQIIHNQFQISPLNYLSTDDDIFNEEDRSEFEVVSFISSSVSQSSSSRTFKTSANHDFGIVFFDERGRRSNVNFLKRVYVGGYSSAERGINKGRVGMRFQLLSAPPDWAHNYAIVYAGNSSTDEFIQYTTGGAFVAANSDNDDGNIYVSLNYLQGNANVSYSGAFGAVSPEGSNDLYTFKKGDKLKVISYFPAQDQKIYPNNLIFDIVDSVDLGKDPETNPLLGEAFEEDSDLAKTGRFLVLKNNPTAFGFTYGDVRQSGNEITTDQHEWNNICVVEIYSPSKIQDFEDRPYYEIAFVGNIKRNLINNEEVNKVYSPYDFTIDSGDVWWRRIPLNTPEFVDDDGLFKFENLIQDEDSVARFKDFFVESKTFNDTFPGNDVNFIGRPNLVLPNAREIRRRSSVTFSDKNNYATTISRFTSFNASTLNFKDIPNEYGAINYLLNTYDSLFVVQEDKASAIPVSRQILATATGQEQIIASSDILGTQKFFAGDYGADNNPESVCKIGNNIYFAHKSNHEVYKFNPSNGLKVISDKGMNSFFVELFRAANEAEGKVRVVGGYDPLKDEFLITVFNQETNEVEAVEYVLQPVGLNVIQDIPDDDGGEDDGVGIGDDSDEGDGIEDDGGSPGDDTEDTDTGTGSL